MRPEPVPALLANLPLSLGNALRAAAAEVPTGLSSAWPAARWSYGWLDAESDRVRPACTHWACAKART